MPPILNLLGLAGQAAKIIVEAVVYSTSDNVNNKLLSILVLYTKNGNTVGIELNHAATIGRIKANPDLISSSVRYLEGDEVTL